MAPEPIRRIVAAARRRLVAAGLTRRMAGWVGAAAALGAALAAVARHWVVEWADPVALGLTGVALVAAVVWSLLRRPSAQRAAIAVDRRLGGYDRVTTALELAERSDAGPLVERQISQAAAWAEARDVRGIATLVPDRRVLSLSGLAVVALVALVFTPAPADVALAERRAAREAIAQEADRAEELAEEVPETVSDTLEELVADLRQAEDIEAALEALGEARQELTEALDPAALAKRTGLAGLEASFRQQPIGEGETAASQMRDLASRLEAGDQPDLADAIAQLEARAEDFAGVDPELSQALGDAADSLRRLATGQGDRAAAAEALERAAEVTERAHQAAADQEALARAAGELGDAQRRLAGEGEGEGRGEGQGQGRGEGQGQGQGQGQGEGQGQG
ncbi:MAG: hypothetical protein C0P76_007420, partial [Acidimicrobiia bacterium]